LNAGGTYRITKGGAMSINRMLWKVPFTADDLPRWPCPTCGAGVLVLHKNSFKKFETRESGKARLDINWDPEWLMYEYSSILECNNKDCGERVLSCGHGSVEEYDVYESDNAYDMHAEFRDLFTPEFFFPPLVLFSIPSDCPGSVADEIKASFKVFFCDPPAALNHARRSVEQILTERGVKRFGKTRRLINLHDRIAIFSETNREIGDQLLAIKWLGNQGSHPGAISKDDVMDAYEILEYVLNELYVSHKKAIEKTVKLINKRKGSIRKH
jgi:hypothetical protein